MPSKRVPSAHPTIPAVDAEDGKVDEERSSRLRVRDGVDGDGKATEVDEDGVALSVLDSAVQRHSRKVARAPRGRSAASPRDDCVLGHQKPPSITTSFSWVMN